MNRSLKLNNMKEKLENLYEDCHQCCKETKHHYKYVYTFADKYKISRVMYEQVCEECSYVKTTSVTEKLWLRWRAENSHQLKLNLQEEEKDLITESEVCEVCNSKTKHKYIFGFKHLSAEKIPCIVYERVCLNCKHKIRNYMTSKAWNDLREVTNAPKFKT